MKKTVSKGLQGRVKNAPRRKLNPDWIAAGPEADVHFGAPATPLNVGPPPRLWGFTETRYRPMPSSEVKHLRRQLRLAREEIGRLQVQVVIDQCYPLPRLLERLRCEEVTLKVDILPDKTLRLARWVALNLLMEERALAD